MTTRLGVRTLKVQTLRPLQPARARALSRPPQHTTNPSTTPANMYRPLTPPPTLKPGMAPPLANYTASAPRLLAPAFAYGPTMPSPPAPKPESVHPRPQSAGLMQLYTSQGSPTPYFAPASVYGHYRSARPAAIALSSHPMFRPETQPPYYSDPAVREQKRRELIGPASFAGTKPTEVGVEEKKVEAIVEPELHWKVVRLHTPLTSCFLNSTRAMLTSLVQADELGGAPPAALSKQLKARWVQLYKRRS